MMVQRISAGWLALGGSATVVYTAAEADHSKTGPSGDTKNNNVVVTTTWRALASLRFATDTMVVIMLLLFFSLLEQHRASAATLPSPTTDTEKSNSRNLLQDHREGPVYGERCTTFCSLESYSKCVDGTCSCTNVHPVPVNKTCLKAIHYGDPCDFDEQCKHYDSHVECKIDKRSYKECLCEHQYEMRQITDYKKCFASYDRIKADTPTLLGMVLVLSMFSAVLCLVLKIFARARYARTRRYANAAIPPPLTVSAVSHPPIILQFVGGGGVKRGLPRRVTSPSFRHISNPSTKGNRNSLPDTLILPSAETYAAFALTNGGGPGSVSPRSERYNPHRKYSSRRTSSASYRTPSGSRYPSMTSLRSGELLRSASYIRPGKCSVRTAGGSRYTSMSSLRSGDLLQSASYIRPGSRRPSISSLRSGNFAIVEPRGLDSRDHYLVYIRGPARSFSSTTSSPSCDSMRNLGQRSTDQLLAIYHTVPAEKNSATHDKGRVSSGSGSNAGPVTKTGILRLSSAGPSESLRSMSTEDVFLEEQEEDVEEEEEDQAVLLEEDEESEGDVNTSDSKLVK